MRPGTTLLLGLALLTLGAGCSEPGRKSRPAGEGPYLLRGRLVNAETGAQVSRSTFWLHFFCDDIDHQSTLDPAGATDYAVRMPQAKVRVRAFDSTDEYHLFETTLALAGDKREYDIALRPTHYVMLRGRVIDGATGKPIVPTSGMGAGPLLYVSAAGTSWHGASFVPEGDGTFLFRAPRTTLSISAVNTSKGVRTRTLDLSGVTAAEHSAEFVLE